MNPLRVALVTRTFWPIAGVTEMMLADLASEMSRLGARVTIITAQWEKHWPKSLVFRDARIVRVPYSSSGWGTLRYMGGVGKWLRAHQDEIDVALVSELKHEAYSVVGALGRSQVPVVLRPAAGGVAGDCNWQQTARFGRRIQRRCQDADALLAPSATIAEELGSSGYASDRTHSSHPGHAALEPRTALRRKEARYSLAKLHDLFALAENAPLAVYAGTFHEAMGLHELVDAYAAVVRRWPHARLWLLGEGIHGQDIWRKIRRMELANHVIMPGMFDDLGEVLYAADVFVQPARDEGQSTALLAAATAGLPIVATETADSRELIDEQLASFVPPGDSKALGDAIAGIFANQELADRRAAHTQQFVRQKFPLEQTTQQLMQLFEKLVQQKSSRAE